MSTADITEKIATKISSADITEKIATKISSADITEKIATKISSAELTEKMKRISTSDFTGKMKKSVDQVACYAKTVADKLPAENTSTKSVVNLNRNGYEVYNIEDSNEVYVARISEKATFDEDNFIVEKAEPGVFVGATAEDTVEVAPAVEVPEVESESLFANVMRGGSREVPVTIGLYRDGVIEEYSGSEYDSMDDIVIIPMNDDLVAELPDVEEETAMVAPVVAAMPEKIEVEPLVTETESNEMLPSADAFINKMTESALTGSDVEPLQCKPMEDNSYSKDALTPVKENKGTSRAPRFVFKDGKIQMVTLEEDSSSFTVNRVVCIEDEVSGVMMLTLPELQSYEDCTEDAPCEQMPDDGMEAMPFPSKEEVSGADEKDKESGCGKVIFDFENRSSDYGLVGFSF